MDAPAQVPEQARESAVLDLEEFVEGASRTLEAVSRAFSEATREQRKSSEVMSYAAMGVDMIASDEAATLCRKYAAAKAEFLDLTRAFNAITAAYNALLDERDKAKSANTRKAAKGR